MLVGGHGASWAKTPSKDNRRDEDADAGESAHPTPTGRWKPPVGEQEQAKGQQREEGQDRSRLGEHQDPGCRREIGRDHRFRGDQDKVRIVCHQHRARPPGEKKAAEEGGGGHGPHHRVAGLQGDHQPVATATAAETAVFRRATTAKPMLRDRQPSTNPAVQPAESDRTITRRRTSPRSSSTQ